MSYNRGIDRDTPTVVLSAGYETWWLAQVGFVYLGQNLWLPLGKECCAVSEYYLLQYTQNGLQQEMKLNLIARQCSEDVLLHRAVESGTCQMHS